MDKEKFQEFLKVIEEESKGKKDFFAKSTDIRMNTLGEFAGMDNSRENFSLQLNEHGLDHALKKFDIPGLSTYGRHLYDNNDTYRLSNLYNYHLDQYNEKHGEKDWFVRSKNDTCRALFSDKYSVIDNDFVADILSKRFKDENISMVGSRLNDKFLNMRITLNEQQINAGTLQNKDPLYVGLHVLNSEIGKCSLMIIPIIYREVCTNGMISVQERGSIFKQRHILNKDDSEHIIAENIEQAIQSSVAQMDRFASSIDVEIDEPIELITRVAQRNRLPQKFTEKIVNEYNQEPGKNLYRVLNGFTGAARDVSEYENRIEVEKIAGDLMNAYVA